MRRQVFGTLQRTASCCGEDENSRQNEGKRRGETGSIQLNPEFALPPETLERYGMRPGTTVRFEEHANGVFLRRPLTHLAKVYIEPTNWCNLGCLACIRQVWGEPAGLMSAGVLERVLSGLRSFSPAPAVLLGGFGEPLAHPEIMGMVVRSKEAGCRVELVTNGTLLTEVLARSLIESGLDRLWVSLDGATEPTYNQVRPGARLDQVVKNITAFQSANHANRRHETGLGIVFVAMHRNLADLPALLRLGRRVGARRILVSNVLPHTAEMKREVLYSHALESTEEPESTGARVLMLPRMDPEPLWGAVLPAIAHAGWTVEKGENSPEVELNRCPFIESGATAIGWDGRVSPCLPLLYSHVSFVNGQPRRTRQYSVGNIIDDSLENLWMSNDYLSNDYLSFREKVRAFDFAPCNACAGCDLSAGNETDCFGNGFPTCGGCPWAQGILRCP